MSFNPKFICDVDNLKVFRFRSFEFLKNAKGKISIFKNEKKTQPIYGGNWENLTELKNGLKNWLEVEEVLKQFN